jgi:hypothetical protein
MKIQIKVIHEISLLNKVNSFYKGEQGNRSFCHHYIKDGKNYFFEEYPDENLDSMFVIYEDEFENKILEIEKGVKNNKLFQVLNKDKEMLESLLEEFASFSLDYADTGNISDIEINYI